jgi:hypothetical protein
MPSRDPKLCSDGRLSEAAPAAYVHSYTCACLDICMTIQISNATCLGSRTCPTWDEHDIHVEGGTWSTMTVEEALLHLPHRRWSATQKNESKHIIKMNWYYPEFPTLEKNQWNDNLIGIQYHQRLVAASLHLPIICITHKKSWHDMFISAHTDEKCTFPCTIPLF